MREEEDSSSRPGARLWERVIGVLDRATTAPRRRHAEALFWAGESRRRDRLASNLFFELSAPLWGRRAFDEEHLAPFTASLERCPAPRRAADLGTGAGASAWRLAERFPAAEVVGVDSARAMLRVARSRFRSGNLRFVRADQGRLPFPDGYFDTVTALNALPPPAEVARVCAPGGRFAMSNTYMRADQGILERFGAHGLRLVVQEVVGAGGFALFEREGGAEDRAG